MTDANRTQTGQPTASAERARGYYSTARLRQGATWFMIGKAVTAPLSILVPIVLASLLVEADFAMFVWLIAFGQFAHRVSYFGVNWVAFHYMPVFRVAEDGTALRRFMLGVTAIQAGLVGAMLVVCYLLAPALFSALDQEGRLALFQIYLAVVFADLSAGFLRNGIFEPLLRQGMAQLNLLIQHATFLGGIIALQLTQTDGLTIEPVVLVNLGATWLAYLVALGQLYRLLPKPSGTPPADRSTLPGAARMLRFAGDNYAHDLVRMPGSPQVVVMVGAAVVSVSAFAAFGFARTLALHIQRALPAQLFIGLLRPKIVASYAADKRTDQLNRRIVLISKVSNCLLAPLVAVFVVYGEAIFDLLSSGRYGHGSGPFIVLLLWLTILNFERILVVMVNVLGQSQILRRAAPAALLVVPLALLLVYLGAGSYGLAFGLVAGHLTFVWLVLRQLRSDGHALDFDLAGHGRIVAAALLALPCGFLPALLPLAELSATGLGVAAILVGFVLAMQLTRPFSGAERNALESLLGRRLPLRRQ